MASFSPSVVRPKTDIIGERRERFITIIVAAAAAVPSSSLLPVMARSVHSVRQREAHHMQWSHYTACCVCCAVRRTETKRAEWSGSRPALISTIPSVAAAAATIRFVMMTTTCAVFTLWQANERPLIKSVISRPQGQKHKCISPSYLFVECRTSRKVHQLYRRYTSVNGAITTAPRPKKGIFDRVFHQI